MKELIELVIQIAKMKIYVENLEKENEQLKIENRVLLKMLDK